MAKRVKSIDRALVQRISNTLERSSSTLEHTHMSMLSKDGPVFFFLLLLLPSFNRPTLLVAGLAENLKEAVQKLSKRL